jgi:hypothetical protein
MSGKVTQGRRTVTQYIAALKQAARDIPTVVADMDMIVWFLHGLNDTLKHKCQCDPKGRTWRNFDDLRDHAPAKEVEFNSIKEAKAQLTPLDRTPYGRGRPQRPNTDKQDRMRFHPDHRTRHDHDKRDQPRLGIDKRGQARMNNDD